MLNHYKKRKSEGFTIIEVMIVLAIAGMIILVVLLAVPAVQRNARNTAIKNDASAIAGGISEYESNNNGALPAAISQTAGSSDVTIGTGSTTANAKVQGSTVVSNAAAGTNPRSSGTLRDPGSAGVIVVYFKYSCDGTPSTRSVAIVYDIEKSGGGLSAQCLDT